MNIKCTFSIGALFLFISWQIFTYIELILLVDTTGVYPSVDMTHMCRDIFHVII